MIRIYDPKQNIKLINSVFERAKTMRQRILLLDYDGTIAPFHIERQEAVPYPGVRELLARILTAGHTRLIFVSGRCAREVITLLDLPRPVEVWGSHGWERCDENGSWKVFRIETRALETLARIKEWLASEGLSQHVEVKVGGLALHWRGLPDPERRRLHAMVRRQWHKIAIMAGLNILPFDGGVELRVQGRDKGMVVKSVLDALPGTAAVAYLGDDLTDEDAFVALQGRGLSILVQRKYRPTKAQSWIKPPHELLRFLHCWHRAATHQGSAQFDRHRSCGTGLITTVDPI